MPDVASQRLKHWAIETRFGGVVDTDAISEAARQYSEMGGGQVWLLDASSAGNFEFSALPLIEQELARVRDEYRLDRVAVVLPEAVRAYAAFVTVPVGVRRVDFATRDEAVKWIWNGCR
jgi:O-acetyl-ADP-ribose deacetylase (regulator of RNase III)